MRMFWRRAKASPPVHADDRQALAGALGLRNDPYAAPILRKLMGMTSRVDLGAVYTLELDPGADLYLFDYDAVQAGPAGTKPGWVSAVMVTSRQPFTPLAIRASRKLAQVLESLSASASGGQLVLLPDAPEFNARVSLYARSSEEVAKVLTAAFQERLLTALDRPADDVRFLLGEKQLLLTAKMLGAVKASTDLVEDLVSDLLGLYALLRHSD